MPAADRLQIPEDHRLPHPKRPLDPFQDPFVGNKTVSDNLREMVQSALWTVLGTKAAALTVHVSKTAVTLAGTLDTDLERTTAIGAASLVPQIQSVTDKIKVRRTDDAVAAAKDGAARMVYLRRFCSMDEASTSAAIRQAIAQLDALFSSAGHLPQTLVIVYSNIVGGTVTLDIGMPSGEQPELVAGSEFRIGPVPHDTQIETTAVAGFDGFLAAGDTLAKGTLARPGPAFWQEFPSRDFRPWRGHPEAKVHRVLPDGSGYSGHSPKP